MHARHRLSAGAECRETLQRNFDYAHLLHTLVAEHGREVGPTPDLSIVLMRKPGVDNAELVQRLRADGRVYISHAQVDGETWLRPCFTNVRTTASDVYVSWTSPTRSRARDQPEVNRSRVST